MDKGTHMQKIYISHPAGRKIRREDRKEETNKCKDSERKIKKRKFMNSM
jgi:hypothetical protein